MPNTSIRQIAVKLLIAILLSTAVGMLGTLTYFWSFTTLETLGADGRIRSVDGADAFSTLLLWLQNPGFRESAMPLFIFGSILFFLGYTRFGRTLMK